MMVRIVIAAAVLVFSVACGDDKNPTAPTPVIQPPPSRQATDITCRSTAVVDGVITIEVGATASMRCTLEYNDGTSEDLPSRATWQTDDPAIATVNASGVVRGVSVGETSLVVRLDSVTSRFQVTVIPVPTVTVTAVVVSGPTEVRIGQSVQLTASAQRSDGTSSNVTTDAEWSTDAPFAVDVSQAGIVTGKIANAYATIIARHAEQQGTLKLQVTRPPAVGCLSWDVTLGTGFRRSYADFRFDNSCDDWIRVFGSSIGGDIRVRFENHNQNEIGFTYIDAFNLRPVTGETVREIMLLNSGSLLEDVRRTKLIGLKVRYRQ